MFKKMRYTSKLLEFSHIDITIKMPIRTVGFWDVTRCSLADMNK